MEKHADESAVQETEFWHKVWICKKLQLVLLSEKLFTSWRLFHKIHLACFVSWLLCGSASSWLVQLCNRIQSCCCRPLGHSSGLSLNNYAAEWSDGKHVGRNWCFMCRLHFTADLTAVHTSWSKTELIVSCERFWTTVGKNVSISCKILFTYWK